MNYTIAYVNNKCIYHNREFWKNKDLLNEIYDNYENYNVLNYKKEPVSKTEFIYYKEFCPEFYIKDLNSFEMLNYNMAVGKEIIICFREEYMSQKDKQVSSLELGIKTGNVINLLLAGCFKEAIQVLEVMERDTYLTDERINRYIELIKSADAINYDDEEDT